jgi:CheY-like chemotaxis protein
VSEATAEVPPASASDGRNGGGSTAANNISSILDALTALLKVVVIAAVMVFAFVHWSYFQNWLDSITHGELFGAKFDRAAADKKLDTLINEKANSGADLEFAKSALIRASRVIPALNGARILWVDGNPSNNILEKGILEDIGIKVQLALDTTSALKFLEYEPFDLVITNIVRDKDQLVPLSKCQIAYFAFPIQQLSSSYQNDLSRFNLQMLKTPPAGFAMAEILADKFPTMFGDSQVPRIIFYTAASGGIAADACARLITNRPDVLLQSVVSALEEFRWQKLSAAN